MRLHTLHELDKSEGTVQLHEISHAESDTIVLVPRPSETDPNDPFRWPAWKKNVAFSSVCAFTFLTNYAIGGLAPAFYVLSLEFNQTMAQTSDLLIWPILVLGVFNFFWVPVANYCGKRPVFVFASLLLTVSYIWGGTAKSFNSLLWSNIIAAFAGSSTEALGASIVNDLFFLHERGAKMGIYMNAISGGNTIGPLFCGFTIQRLSWRWHKWIAVILTGINFLSVLFFVPETRYQRNEGLNVAVPTAQPGDSAEIPTLVARASEKGETPKVDPKSSQDSSPERGTTNEALKKTYLQELSLWSSAPPNTNLLKMFLRPLPMIFYPCIIYAFLGYAISLVLTVAINILNPFVLQAPPYSWSPMINSLINIAGFIGNLSGAYAGGWLVDVYTDWRARRNQGVFEPESRLWLLVLPTLITGAGCLVFGYGVQRTLHWSSLFFGYGMVSFALTAVPTITMTYVSDCLLPVNADALMLVNGLKNIVAFGFLYGIIPWVDTTGYIICFGTQAGIFVGIVAIGAVWLIMFGTRMRHVQATWRIIL
ncbi:major facilitator superfamily domain-containing protein [Pseudomassariella vexata]|uniref:Major facilitator superfamily domain-containing protein n=1 Tax=Pseudomassariella vexata TaxID=1141098 RepID=A0A1Y2E471_9PEZI|nr:major facilitator superfamily domain-containing protein [Pseudomassariella vexata]ORY66086.1 major facilitator superfamily domain-containing protein [Pseudomassariella vexata]